MLKGGQGGRETLTPILLYMQPDGILARKLDPLFSEQIGYLYSDPVACFHKGIGVRHVGIMSLRPRAAKQLCDELDELFQRYIKQTKTEARITPFEELTRLFMVMMVSAKDIIERGFGPISNITFEELV